MVTDRNGIDSRRARISQLRKRFRLARTALRETEIVLEGCDRRLQRMALSVEQFASIDKIIAGAEEMATTTKVISDQRAPSGDAAQREVSS